MQAYALSFPIFVSVWCTEMMQLRFCKFISVISDICHTESNGEVI